MTSIGMPSYNPNVPALSLTYNSLAANAMPIVVAEHPLSASLATPSKVSAKLTFDGTAGTTYYFNSSSLTPGDIMQIGLQANATSLDTGSYPYTMTVADDRSGSWTTVTYNGTATVENAAKDPTFLALGAGWTVNGLMKIIPATGGVLLDEGGGSVAVVLRQLRRRRRDLHQPGRGFQHPGAQQQRDLHADPHRRHPAELRLDRPGDHQRRS